MTIPLRVLVVDDEPLARTRLRRMLAGEPAVIVVAECGTGSQALEAVRQHAPDLLLLDVQMPDGDGLEVAGSLSETTLPRVVFVTAFDEYALRAFDAAAVDYLLKPVRRARLRIALERVREVVSLYRARGEPAAIQDVREPDQQLPAARLLVDRGRHMDVVPIDAIDWIEAADSYVIVHVAGERHRYRRTMEQVLERLPADRFARAHRSAIVNLDRVRQVHPWFHGSYLLSLADGTKVTVGRQYRDRLLERLRVLR